MLKWIMLGHWEGDLIKGANNQSAVGVLVERSTRPVLLCRMPDATAESALAAFTAILPGRFTQKPPMLLSLHIDQQAPNRYSARVLDHQTEVDEFFTEDIQSAISLAGQEGYGAQGFHIWYGVVCIGTTTVHAMRTERELLANRLVHLRGQFEDD